MESTSDQELLGADASGDAAEFEQLYARTAPAVARFAWSLSRSSEAVEELLQDTYLTAWRKRSAITFVNGSALPWLLLTCRNFARNRARNDRRRREALRRYEQSIDVDPVNGEAALDLAWALATIAALPDLDRQVCELCLLHGLSYREAADRLSISEASVGKRLHRARVTLRQEAER